MKFREKTLESGTRILVGRNAENNDELIKKFKGEQNIIMHTVAPGSPFCVIDELNPSPKDVSASGAICARYSQDWRDNKSNVKVSIFTGKDINKERSMKTGMWKVKKSKTKIIKKEDIKKLI